MATLRGRRRRRHAHQGPRTGISLTIAQRSRRPHFDFEANLGTRSFPFCSKNPSERFLRGEANGDGVLDMTDGIVLVVHLFVGSSSVQGCEDRLDVNDDGVLDISDPIALLRWMFAGAPPPPPPFEQCGADPTADSLGCASVRCQV